MEHEDTTRVVREYYVIKIKKDDQEVYWTESKKQTNYTAELSRAKKYKIYDEAKAKALQICEANSMVTWVIRYIESIRETYTDVCLPFKSRLNNNSLTLKKDELD